MKTIKAIIILTLVSIFTTTTYAAEVPREAAPCNAPKEAIIFVESCIGDILTEVQNGLGYAEAKFNARNKIYQSVKPDFNPNVEYMKDPLSRDIPPMDNSLFILARKLILESKYRRKV